MKLSLFRTSLVFFICFLTRASVIYGQNINGEKIQVAADALTVMKFNSEIKRYELGDRKGYTCQVRDNDNSIVIKTMEDKPASTNLVVTEGKRTHYFVIVFLPKIDLNNTRLYYDYSDLKVVKRLAENTQAVAVNDAPKANTKKDEVPAESKKARKQREKEEEQAAEEAKKKEEQEKQALAAQQKKQQEKIRQQELEEEAKKQAARKEQERIAAEKQRQQQELQEKQEQERQAKLAKEEERVRLEREQQDKIAKAKEAERERKAAEETARIQKIKDEREAALAKQKEQQRLDAERKKQDAEAKERKRLEEENKKKLAAEQEKARKEKEKQDKLARMEEEKRKKEEEARLKREAEANKTEYTQAELWKKYPNIVFADPPEGQHMAGEYYIPADTMENFRVSSKLMNIDTWLNEQSAEVNGVQVTLQSMIFSGVNCYMRFRVVNTSKNDFLIGRMNLRWNKAGEGGTDLFPCYVNGYVPVLPGKERIVIYASRAVNAGAKDKFSFSMEDRLKKMRFEVPFTGAMYNLEMSR